MNLQNKYKPVGVGTCAAWVAVLALGCAASNEAETPAAEGPSEPQIAVADEAITASCRLSTVGLPCDPDGAGAASECEGVCWANDEALVSCRPVAELNLTAVDLNGRICGDVDGNNCGQSCENGACVEKNARLGTACRPANNSTTCDGVCTLINGQPACDEVDSCNAVGISPDGCSLTACNFETFKLGCQTFELENPICEASREPVVEAGVTDTESTATADAAVDAAANTGTGAQTAGSETSSSTDVTSGESTSANTTGAPSSGVVDAGGRFVDAGDAGPLPPINNATKVVGGACSAGGLTPASGSAFTWASLAAVFVFARRRRSTRRAGASAE